MLNVCFTCSREYSHGLLDANSKDSSGVTYLEKLQCIFPVSLYHTPSVFICANCRENLTISCNFFYLVSQSQKELRLKNPHEDDDGITGITQLTYLLERLKNENIKKGEVSDDNKDDFFDLSNHSDSNEEEVSFQKSSGSDTRILRSHVICQGCRVYFNTQRLFKKHLPSCRNPVKDKCQLCLKAFKNENEYKTHDCDATLEDLVIDEKIELNDADEDGEEVESSAKCDLCDAVFSKQWILRKHISRVHGEEKTYICGICKKGFKQSYHLREHMTKHTGEKKYSCNICGKQFQRMSSRSRHIRGHALAPGHKSKRTPFLCTICGKNFPYSNSMQRHMRMHLGIKTHECLVCHKLFNQSTHLRVHMRIHTGEKPFVCEICGSAFALNASLQKHRTMHENKMKKEDNVPQTSRKATTSLYSCYD